MSETQTPAAWMFVQPSGEVRFVLHDKARADAWATAHEGEIVPLYPAPVVTDAERKAIEYVACEGRVGNVGDQRIISEFLARLT